MTLDDLVRAKRSSIIKAAGSYLEKEAIDPEHLKQLLIGGGIGAVGGGIAGAAKGKEHRGRNVAIGALLGGGLGAGTAELLRRTEREDKITGAREATDRVNKAIETGDTEELYRDLDPATGGARALQSPGLSGLAGLGSGALAGAAIGGLTAKEKKNRLRHAGLGALLGGGAGLVGGGIIGEGAKGKGWDTVVEGFNKMDPSGGPLTGMTAGRLP